MSNKIKTTGAAAQESRVAVPQAAQAADGVPAESGRRVLVDCGVLQMVLNALERDALEGKQVRAEMRMELMQSITHPTQQGLDARTAYEAECFRWLRDEALKVWKKGPVVFMTDADGCPGDGGAWSDNILSGENLERAIPVAAQAKQGGAEHG